MRALLLCLLLFVPTAQAARVVALAPHLAELVCAAGACDQLVGAVAYSDYPESVKKLPQVGDAFAVNAEMLLSLKPDLVLSWEGGSAARPEIQLRRLGLHVESIQVEKFGDIERALLKIGSLLHTENAARQSAEAFRRRIDALTLKYRDAPKIRVFFQIQAEPVYTVNRNSPISEAIALCGGINVFADLPKLAGTISKEALIATDPQVVVWGQQEDGARIRALWQRWPQLQAMRLQNLYAMNADTLGRATPRLAEGTEELCKVLDQARAKIAARR